MHNEQLVKEFRAEFLDPDSSEYIEKLSDWWIEKLSIAVAKEREENLKIVESFRTGWDNKMVNTIDWKDANDWTIDNILMAIKNRSI